MIDENVKQGLNQIDQFGNKIKGDNWTRYCDGIRLDGGLSEQQAQALVNSRDPVGAVEFAGKEGLLAHMPSGVRASNDTRDPEAVAAQRQAERDYAAIREAERAEYRKMKGRR